MRVCLIGNSHIAAIKVAWDGLQSENGSIAASFFGAPSGLLSDLKIEGSCLVPATKQLEDKLLLVSGGKRAIDVSDYDTFVVVALGFTIRKIIARLLGRYVTVDYRAAAPSASLVSADCLRAAATGVLSETLAVDTIDKILKISKKPVMLVPQPLPAEHLLQSPQKALFAKLIARGNAERAYELFQDAATDIMRNRGVGIEQPDNTRVSSILTKNEFSVGSVRLTENLEVPHPENDYAHMNAEYGAHVWRKLLPALHVR